MHHNKPLDPKIHFIVGILISGFSAYVILFTDVPNKAVMELFLFIGIGFILIAFIKKGIKYISSGKLKRDENEIATNISGVPEAAKEEFELQKQRQAQLRQKRHSIIICQLCATRNYATSNYCHMCGYKLK